MKPEIASERLNRSGVGDEHDDEWNEEETESSGGGMKCEWNEEGDE